MYHWLLFKSLHFGVKRRQCVLNGVKLTPRTLMFQMEYAKVGYCHQNDLLYMLMICHMN